MKKQKIRLAKSVDINFLVPNSWNFNQQSREVFRAEMESIRRNGFCDPILVRKHPKQKGCYEIIDGEHRWLAAKEVGFTKVPVISFGTISDQRAKGISVTFNETKGDAHKTALARVIAEIQGDEDIRVQLPYSDSDLESLINLAESPQMPMDTKEGKDLLSDKPTSIVLYPSAENHEIWEQMVDRFSTLFPRVVEEKDLEAAITLAAMLLASMSDERIKKRFDLANK